MDFDFSKVNESCDVEFKQAVPADSLRYTRTAVAFANGSGGKLFFGVEDLNHEVVGIDRQSVFTAVDAITNAIADSCTPQILADSSLLDCDGRLVVCIDIPEGRHKPYCIKSEGLEDGVYVRICGTTRKADSNTLRELFIEGSTSSPDQVPCKDLIYSGECLEALNGIVSTIATDKSVTESMLSSWGLVSNGFCTRAMAMLIGKESDGLVLSSVQCAAFKGLQRDYLLDKRKYGGSLLEQYRQTVDFVCRNIRLKTRVVGQFREEKLEIPETVIREAVVNMVVHRSYVSDNDSYVAIYDDRIEFLSPGRLVSGMTIPKMMEGYSKVRNRAIASVFNYVGLMDQYGWGIPQMCRLLKDAGLSLPKLEDLGDSIRLTIYREKPNMTDSYGELSTADAEPSYGFVTDYPDAIIKLMVSDPCVTMVQLADKLGLSISTIKRTVAAMLSAGTIERAGNNRRGYWIVRKR